jgi:hypothetical protein
MAITTSFFFLDKTNQASNNKYPFSATIGNLLQRGYFGGLTRPSQFCP